MGRGRKGSGVEPRENSIRVSFTWREQRCRETLALAPTPPNLKYAARLVRDVNRAIEIGTFEYRDFFPNSPRAQASGQAITLRARGQLWLEGQGRLAAATRSQYKNALEFWYAQLGEHTDVRTLPHSRLLSVVGSYPWPSPKLTNNYLIALRGLFRLAVKDKVIDDDPMDGIENSELQRPLPDPFTLEEALAIVADLMENAPESIANYFDAAFFDGFRPEEEIALRWGDEDWKVGIIRVERARSFRGELRPVKGYKARDVEMSARGIEAYKRQRAITGRKAHGFIFENPTTLRPLHDERTQRDHFWYPALDRLGIRRRTPYHTRHTFATLAIMAGCNPTWVARQMGNSPLMVYKHYATWIAKANKSRERAKLDAALAEFVPDLSRTGEDAGRRDWTRTIPTLRPQRKVRA